LRELGLDGRSVRAVVVDQVPLLVDLFMSVPLTESSVVFCDADVVSCDLAGGSALLDLRSGTYFSINPVGAFIWGMLREPIPVSDIQDALMARYDVERDKCFEDLSKLLQDLSEAGLVVFVDAAPR
jgi:hypothetical protein